MKRILFLVFITSIILSYTVTNSFSQCKRFTKNNCLPKLKPYTYNGQLNSAVLSQGDEAYLKLIFYPEQEYRILVCGNPILGNIHFRLFTDNGVLVYDNETMDYLPFWDFKTDQTIELTLKIMVPPASEDDYTVKDGCVSILVGFKEKNNKTDQKKN